MVREGNKKNVKSISVRIKILYILYIKRSIIIEQKISFYNDDWLAICDKWRIFLTVAIICKSYFYIYPTGHHYFSVISLSTIQSSHNHFRSIVNRFVNDENVTWCQNKREVLSLSTICDMASFTLPIVSHRDSFIHNFFLWDLFSAFFENLISTKVDW